MEEKAKAPFWKPAFIYGAILGVVGILLSLLVSEPETELPEKYVNMSWLFFLNEQADGTTRLISRSRNDWNDSFGNTVFYSIFGVPTMEMDRKMLKGIKKRAERSIKNI